LLVRHFLEMYGERFGRPGVEIDREAIRALSEHPFPGNVRELENVIQAAVALAPPDGVISVADLELGHGGAADAIEHAGRFSLEEVERRHIESVIREVGGSRQEAARILGIDRSTLYRKLRRFASDDA
jgi:two-component system response regulator HydG